VETVRIVFIAAAVDAADPMQPTTVRWIDALARKPTITHVTVITLRVGEHDLPQHVEVRTIGHPRRVGRLVGFCAEVFRAVRRGVDFFFVYQGGTYPALLLPVRLLLGLPVYQWKAHPHVSPSMWFYARFCDTLVFTSTTKAFPLALPNVRVVGQGIDTDRFRIIPGSKEPRWVSVGRLSPVKRLDRMLIALARCNRRFGTRQGLDFYGATPAGEASYRERLDRIVQEEELTELVTFHGPVRQDQLPAILNRYPIFLHFCTGALDKSVAEAMACGVTVLSTNRCVGEIIPADLRSDLVLPEDDVEAQAVAMHAAMGWGAERRTCTGERLRAVVVEHHDVTGLIERILGEMRHEDAGERFDHSANGMVLAGAARKARDRAP
jgi:glycosyltransferase involved in cell wall biosynthesis